MVASQSLQSPSERVLPQPILTRLVPRQPFLFTLGQVVKVPSHEADDAKDRHGQEYKECDEEGSAAGAAGTACAQGVVVMVVHLNGAVAARVGGR